MKVLVTGGCGFIGSNLIRYLLERADDYQVVNLDALTYAGNPANLADLQGHPGYTFVPGDICDRVLVERLMGSGVDAIVHLAAESHVDRSILDPADFVRTNVLGTQTLLDVARQRGVHRFLHVSTDEVYGSLGAVGHFTEASSLAPNSAYVASKAAADLLVRAYVHTYGVPALQLSQDGKIPVPVTAWYHKAEPTFADCLVLVRGHLWRARYLVNSTVEREFMQFPREAFELLLMGIPLAA